MSDRKRRLRHLANRGKEPHWLFFLPLMLIVGWVPLVMRARETTLAEAERFLFSQALTYVDVFHYYKAFWFIFLTVLAGLSLWWLHYQGIRLIQKERWMWPLGLYMVLVMIAFLNSESFTVGWRGFATSFQGVWVYLTYGALVFILSQMIRTRKDVERLILPLLIMGGLLTFIGATQLFGGQQFDEHALFGPIQDIFRYSWMQELLLPSRFQEASEVVRVTGSRGRIYGTFYNSNFVGSFGVLAIFFAMGLFFFTKRLALKIALMVFVAGMVFVFVGSNSRTGFVGLVVGIFVIIVLVLPKFYRVASWQILLALGVIALSLFGVNRLTEGRYQAQIERLFEPIVRDERPQVLAVDLDGYRVSIETEERFFTVVWTGSQVLFYNELDEVMTFSLDQSRYYLTAPGFEDVNVQTDFSNSRLRVRFDERLLDVYFMEDGFGVLGVGGFTQEIVNAPRAEFLRGYERIFSSRGYIYSVSIPVLRQTWLIGAGPDHYVLAIPQNDVAGRLNGFNMTAGIDKAHNMFLQFGIEIGIVATLALLSLLIWPALEITKNVIRVTPVTLMKVAWFAGLIGALVSGLSNELTMSLAPLFFMMYGLLMIKFEDNT